MGPKRVLFLEKTLHLTPEWGDPGRIVAIDLERKLTKELKIGGIIYSGNLEIIGKTSFV
jgi:hypothetical protein